MRVDFRNFKIGIVFDSLPGFIDKIKAVDSIAGLVGMHLSSKKIEAILIDNRRMVLQFDRGTLALARQSLPDELLCGFR